MAIFEKSSMEIIHVDATASSTWPCTVKFIGDEVRIEYKQEPYGIVAYIGKEDGPGHYRLRSERPKGTATLHRFSDDEYLIGDWREHVDQVPYQGVWRITLDTDKI